MTPSVEEKANIEEQKDVVVVLEESTREQGKQGSEIVVVLVNADDSGE